MSRASAVLILIYKTNTHNNKDASYNFAYTFHRIYSTYKKKIKLIFFKVVNRNCQSEYFQKNRLNLILIAVLKKS